MGLRTYTVKHGDTLATIAEDHYDDPALFAYIYQANRHYIHDVNQVTVGQVLIIPHLPFKDRIQRFFNGAPD